MPDSATYWGTVAQIVPVLFLAVTLEARWTFARLSKTGGDYRRSRGIRAVTALNLVVVTLALGGVLGQSLNSLREGRPADGTDGYVASLVLSVAAGLGLGGPAIALAILASEDYWTALHRRMPWSEIARLRRRHARGAELSQKQDRQIQSLMLHLRTSLASSYVQASQAELSARHCSEPMRSQLMRSAIEMYAFADQSRAKIDELGRDRPEETAPLDLPPLLEAELERFRSRLADVANRAT